MSEPEATTPGRVPFVAPFRHPAFAVIWTATLVSNIGGWMYSAASGWLMTSLNPDPLIVALVAAMSSLPICLFAIPAGALADIFDKRKFLIVVETLTTAVSAIYAVIVGLGLATPGNLLLFTFLIGAAGALDGAGLAGRRAATRSQKRSAACDRRQQRRRQYFARARSRARRCDDFGLRHCRTVLAQCGVESGDRRVACCGGVRRNGPAPGCRPSVSVRRSWRACATPGIIGICARRWSAPPVSFCSPAPIGRCLPLVAREQIAGGAGLYGILLGVIGAGAVSGAFLLPWLKEKLGPDRLMALGALGQAVAMVLYGLARDPLTALLASAIAGASWIAALATLSVSAQVALPDWVRGRGLALYTTVFFGCLTLGSAGWGEVAAIVGLPAAHFLAAAGAVAAIALTWPWKLQTGAGVDLTPSMHWPAPLTAQQIEHDRGPVLVTVEYRIRPSDRKAFLEALAKLEHQRRRDGAYAWGVFEDAAEEGRIVETFLVESWMEHLRQHERVTQADRVLQDAVHRFHLAGVPKVTHLIAAEPE